MEVTDILGTRTYELTDENKVLVIKNWLGLEGLELIKPLIHEEKENAKLQKASS